MTRIMERLASLVFEPKCDHWKGGGIVGPYWVCGNCWKPVDRPVKFTMEPVPQRQGPLTGPLADNTVKSRQVPIYAPVLVCEGVTLTEFVDMMARRLVARTRGGFTMYDAREYALGILRTLEEPFGADDFAWDETGAHDIVDCWDEEGAEGAGGNA